MKRRELPNLRVRGAEHAVIQIGAIVAGIPSAIRLLLFAWGRTCLATIVGQLVSAVFRLVSASWSS